MRQCVEQRLTELRSELRSGQQMLAELESKQAHLRSSLLRISGAIQVLEELLTEPPGENGRFPAMPGLETAVTGQRHADR
jgi:hypothetical protein